MAFQPTDLQKTRLQQAIVEVRRYPGWSVVKQFYTAEAANGAEADLGGLTVFVLQLFTEALNAEAEFATARVKREGYVASD
jgi:ribosomal protein L39E